MEDFNKRQEKFQEELSKLAAKYKIDIYAANVVLNNSEVMPAVKLVDLAKEDADKPSEQPATDKEA